MLRTAVTSFLALAPAIAAADTGGESVHHFASLDRASGRTDVGADLSVVTGGFGDGSGWISRLDLHGEYMSPSNFGFYGSIAVSKAFLDADSMVPAFTDDVNDKLVLSNLELGGVYRAALDQGWSIVGHAGVVLPTSSSGSFGAIAANLLSVAGRRYNDAVTALPKTTSLRVGVSPSWSDGGLFARADVGADVVLYQQDASGDVSHRPVLRGNVAVGARTGKLSGALELVTLASTQSLMDGASRFFHTAAVSVQYDAGNITPSLAVVTPLGNGDTGNVFGIGVGVASSF